MALVNPANALSPYLISIGNNQFVKLSLKASSYSAGLETALGLIPVIDGRSYNNRILVGQGRLAAMQNGCFGINLVYARTANVNLIAKVLCSPTKADTIFQEGKGQTYNGKNIVEVRVPRRQKYTF